MKHLFALLLLCLSLTAFAQPHFREGYVVTTAGDTLTGYLAYNGETENARACSFKSSPEGDKRTFLPGDIAAYRFSNDKKYVSHTIKTDGADEKVFLECLIEGVVTVYYLKGSAQDRFFIVKNAGAQKNDGMQELNNNVRYFKSANGITYSMRTNQYNGLLSNYFSDAPEVARRVNRINLHREDLVAISEAYHQAVCSTEKCTVYKKRFPKPAYYLGASATGIVQHVRYDPFYQKYDDVDAPGNIASGVGISLQANAPRINEKLSLGLYAGYQRHAFSGVKYDFLDRPSAVNYQLEVLQTELFLLYRFRGRRMRPFVRAGAPIAFVLGSKGFTRDAREGVSVDFAANAPLQNNTYGINVGAGLEKDLGTRNKVFIALSYNKSFSYVHDRLRVSGLWLTTGILWRAF
ncbi:MAG: hypothetical protein ICV83_19590 [Cytophagales bacterium]|nr:hypothetical protein [Cytophagales bacterium]